MSRNDKPVLVTGGCGFIGVNLVSMLAASGARVRVLDDLSAGSREALEEAAPGAEVIRGDVTDLDTAVAACRGVEAVFHLAAQPGVIPSILDPETDFRINAGGTLNMLIAAQREDVGAFVLASSNAAVGEFSAGTDETTPPRPLSPYGASKLAGEAYCSAFAGSFGMRTVSLRFANAYGPQSSHKQSVIARFIKRVIEEQPLTVYGDGEYVRDFIHVEDMCRAMLLAADSESASGAFHIASGRGTTVNELVKLFEAVVGRKLPVTKEPPREGEARRITPSVEKARRELGFEAQVVLADGLAATYDWFRSRSASEVAP